MSKKLKPYPGVICADCGEKYGKHRGGVSTWYSVDCRVCGETKTGTETRDYGYPKLRGFSVPKLPEYINLLNFLFSGK